MKSAMVPKDVQFCGLYRRVVRILNLFQQFAIVVKQALNPAAENQFFDDSNGQVGLARTDCADDQQSLVAARVAFAGKVRGDEVSLSQRWIRTRESRCRS